MALANLHAPYCLRSRFARLTQASPLCNTVYCTCAHRHKACQQAFLSQQMILVTTTTPRIPGCATSFRRQGLGQGAHVKYSRGSRWVLVKSKQQSRMSEDLSQLLSLLNRYALQDFDVREGEPTNPFYQYFDVTPQALQVWPIAPSTCMVP